MICEITITTGYGKECRQSSEYCVYWNDNNNECELIKWLENDR